MDAQNQERENENESERGSGVECGFASASDGPPESGGILGGRDQTVTDIVLDKGRIGGRPCSYTPDVAFLNREIKRWAEKGLRFMGVFHVHFGGAEALSEGDRNYIARIMDAMPEGMIAYIFPLLLCRNAESLRIRQCAQTRK